MLEWHLIHHKNKQLLLLWSTKIKINTQKYCINLWDTAGQKQLKSLKKLYFKGTKIIIFVYDITHKKSFIGLQKWVEEVENIIYNQYIYGIVGNKQDLFTEEEINEDIAKEYNE